MVCEFYLMFEKVRVYHPAAQKNEWREVPHFWTHPYSHIIVGYIPLYHPIWGVLKMGDPQVTIGFTTKSWSSMDDDFGGALDFRKPPYPPSMLPKKRSCSCDLTKIHPTH